MLFIILYIALQFIRSFVRSFIIAGRGPAYSELQRWDLLCRSNAPAQGEKGNW